MAKRTEDLFTEILENSRRDRKTVEAVRDDLVTLSKVADLPEGVTSLAISENIARLSDVLTKMNSQLVEMTKISVKVDQPDKSKDDSGSIYDEIELSDPSSSFDRDTN